MPLLRVDQGDRAGEIIELTRDRMVLGRSPDCDAVISKNEAVGRWHVQILRQADGLYIEDHRKSKNRTWVNDVVIPQQTPVLLKHEDHIRICEFEATFYETYPPGEPNKDPSTVEALLSSSSDHSLETQPAAKLAALLEITAKLSKTLDLDAQLPEVADGLLRLFPQADRCFLILLEEETDGLVPKVIRTRSKIDETTARFSQTIVRQCLQTADAILLSEGDKLPVSSSDSVISSNMRSVMLVPLCSAEGPPFGVIQLDTQDPAKKFTKEDLTLIWGVAHQASIAMENARFHEMRMNQVRVKNELEMARQVQLNFLPRHLPEVPGYEFFAYYEAAREVGGDYYDFIPLAEQRLAVTLGDVAGKGMPAALLMAKLSSESRSCLLSERMITAAIARLNDQLYPFTNPMDRFVTLIAAVLDPTNHTVTLVNAGHPTPLWYRCCERRFCKAVPDEDDGQSLGHALGNTYQAHTVQLAPGDSLLIFSDGVTDAGSISSKPFKMKGIHAILQPNTPDTPRALGERLVRAIQRHAKSGPQYDDITLLCFGRAATP
jgi:phosphoserine phosphatase RsbU/P